MRQRAKGIVFLNVPYKSASLTFPAMLGGEIDMAYLAVGLAAQSVKAGKAKALAVIGPTQRSPIMPDVPTYEEAGLELNIATWFGLVAPAGTPRDIVLRVNTTIAKEVFGNAPVKEKILSNLGIAVEPPAGGPPETFGALIAAEREKMAKLVKIVGLKPE